MVDWLALMTIMMWPLIPILLIEVHFAASFWKRLGFWTYLIIFLEWIPIALVIYLLQETILQYKIAMTSPFVALGITAIVVGLLLHAWTAKLLGIKATIGYPEVKPDKNNQSRRIVTRGPFSVVRHPSYWAHTSILAGVFLITGSIVMGIIVIIDFVIAYFVTTTVEERELIKRFGEQYRRYQTEVPKFFPKIKRRKDTF